MCLDNILTTSNLLSYISGVDLKNILNSSQFMSKLFMKFIKLPQLKDKYINVKYLPTWRKLFPKLTHCSIKGYDRKILHKYLNTYNEVTLDLSYCEKTFEISAFGNVNNIHLRGCTGITDTSMLTGVVNLYK